MSPQRVLISGAGIAGSVSAFWLARYGIHVTVVERSKAEQKMGQGLEIEEPALKVVKAMGILDTLKRKRTSELGFELVNEHAQSYGIFKIGGFSPTGALELMRGDITETLYEAANESANVSYRYETAIQSLRQTQDKVIVDLENRVDKTTSVEEFDYVIGADGVKSRTRQLVMGSIETLDCFKKVGAFVSYFSVPREDQDLPYSRLCHFPGRRIVWLRPIGEKAEMTSVYLIHTGEDVPSLRRANASNDRQKQKEGFADLYRGLGWETPRVIDQMMKATNFYSDELAQVKLPTWSQHRVVLLGDAAWAPTPFTGQGSQLAMIGAWVLAQEMSRDASPAAFETYEKRLRPYVEAGQQIPLRGYAPYLFNPQTALGIWVFRTMYRLLWCVVQVFEWTGLGKYMPDGAGDGFNMQMEEMEEKKKSR